MRIKHVYIGIDPGGSSGSIVAHVEDWDDEVISYSLRFKKATEKEISDFLKRFSKVRCLAILEKVHSMPGQGVASSFAFGQNYGFIKGLLVAHDIPVMEVTPQKWQKEYKPPMKSKRLSNVVKKELRQIYNDDCEARGIEPTAKGFELLCDETRRKYKAFNSTEKVEHKKELRNIAQKLYPTMKIETTTADACLLADYSRRYVNN